MTFENGIILHQQGEYEKAIVEYEKAISIAPHPEVSYNLGLAYGALRNWSQAEEAYKMALKGRPNYQNAMNNLAIVVQNQGRLFEAERLLRTLLLQHPTNRNAQINLGGVLYMQGRPSEAASIIYPALKDLGHHPQGWFTLGVSLRDMGQITESAGCLLRAHQQAPSNPEALLHLGGVLYDVKSPGQTIECFEKAIQNDQNHHYSQFQLGCLLTLVGKSQQGQELLNNLSRTTYHDWISSWEFVVQHKTPSTYFFGTTTQTLQFAVEQSLQHGEIIELGVRFGTTLHYLQQMCNDSVYGFDSFIGLPTSWNELPVGSYSTNGKIPKLGNQVHIYDGWFQETLPEFIKSHCGQIRLLHVDCDLYSSTKQALTILAPKINSGTILVFDEFIMNPKWQNDEYLAFIESAAENNWQYEYLAFGLMSNQAVVRIH